MEYQYLYQFQSEHVILQVNIQDTHTSATGLAPITASEPIGALTAVHKSLTILPFLCKPELDLLMISLPALKVVASWK